MMTAGSLPGQNGEYHNAYAAQFGAPTMPMAAAEVELKAPRRFKTAFIFFSSARHKEIKAELAQEGRTEKVRSSVLLSAIN
jgi:hypothetical protein